jgi:hypothetical protein
MRTLIRVAAATATFAGLVPAFGNAQTPAPPQAASHAASNAQTPSRPAVIAPKTPAPSPSARWVDLQAATLDARYRVIESSAGATTSNHLQHKQTFKAGLKLDAAGKYSVQAAMGTGTSFTGSWEMTGIGTGDRDWNPGIRHLYLAAKPAKGLELQVGGLTMARTENTEITGFDNDGYMVGERVSVKRPKQLYLDEVTLTVGYFGDLSTPNVFKRLDSLDNHNFTQIVAAKKLGARVATSVDWARIAGADAWHEAARVAVKEAKVVDAVRLELYQRVGGVDGNGYAAGVEKALPRKIALTVGVANIDQANPLINGDRYGRGQRVFTDIKVPLPADLSLNVFYTRAFDNDFALPLKTRFDMVVSYNVLKAVQKAVK